MEKEIKYEIKKEIAVLSTANSGWTREVNLLSWNDAEPKYDIRDWSPDKEKMGKGIALSKAEAQALVDVLKKELK